MDGSAVAWDGAYNVRDLGGLPTRDGRRTRLGAFFRSASPRFMTVDGWQQAHDAGVRTVVDLRRADEAADDPRPTRAAAEEPEAVAEDYERSGPALAPVFERVGRPDEQPHVDAVLAETARPPARC